MNKQERFVRPIDCWEDTYEGFLLHLMDNENGLKETIHTLYADLMHNDVNLTIDKRIGCVGRYEQHATQRNTRTACQESQSMISLEQVQMAVLDPIPNDKYTLLVSHFSSRDIHDSFPPR